MLFFTGQINFICLFFQDFSPSSEYQQTLQDASTENFMSTMSRSRNTSQNSQFFTLPRSNSYPYTPGSSVEWWQSPRSAGYYQEGPIRQGGSPPRGRADSMSPPLRRSPPLSQRQGKASDTMSAFTVIRP